MVYTLEAFIVDAQTSLRRDPGPKGREAVRAGLERLLANPDFIATVRGFDPAEKVRLLHADKELGFRILAHVSRPSQEHAPHNHGKSWAIYGQVSNYTDMTEWVRGIGKGPQAGIKIAKQYRLSPGQAGIYENGAIHSVSHPDGGRIIRITGTDLDKIDRERFDPKTGTAENMRGAG
jgi:predicted metal-dependent enzyme (double-stranded beta helix superfamily)